MNQLEKSDKVEET